MNFQFLLNEIEYFGGVSARLENLAEEHCGIQ